MSQYGIVTVTGYVTAEPKLRHTRQSGTPVTSVRIGSTPRRMDRDTGEWQDGQASYFTVNCWRKLAMNVRASLHKGDPVIVRGKLRTRQWLEDGRPRTEVEIDADSIGHDLSAGWSNFLREGRPRQEEADGAGEGESIRHALDTEDGPDAAGYDDSDEDNASPAAAGIGAARRAPAGSLADGDVLTESAIAELGPDSGDDSGSGQEMDAEPTAVGR